MSEHDNSGNENGVARKQLEKKPRLAAPLANALNDRKWVILTAKRPGRRPALTADRVPHAGRRG